MNIIYTLAYTYGLNKFFQSMGVKGKLNELIMSTILVASCIMIEILKVL